MISERWKNWTRWSLAFLFFAGIAFIWCRPIHRYLFSGIPYEVEPHAGIEVVEASPQDCLQLYYKYWLFSETAMGKIPLFSDPYEFAVPGARGFTRQQFPVSIIFALLRPISPVFAYNVIILLSFVACGLFMLKLALAKTHNWPASLAAGLIFCIMPFRPPQLMAGHPNGVAVCFVPLTLYFISRAQMTGSLWVSLGAGLTYSSIALLDMQLAFFSAILIALFTAYETISNVIRNRTGASWQKHVQWFFRWALPMGVGVLPGVIYLGFMKLVVLKASAIHGSGSTRGRIGPMLEDLWDITVCGERRIYFGPWVLALAICGLILPALRRCRWRERLSHCAEPLFWGFLVVAGLSLSLAMNPPFDRIMARIPMANFSRTPARASIITFTGFPLLAAVALASIRRLLGKRRAAQSAYLCLVALVLALVAHNYRLRGPRGINIIPETSPAYEHATAESPEARVLASPIWPGDSAMSASLFHHIAKSRAHLINGYSPVASSNYHENVFGPLKQVNVGQFSESEWQTAQELKITHVTFHPESFPAPNHVSVFPADLTLARLKQTPTLEWVLHADPVDLFRIVQTPDTYTIDAPATSPIGITIEGRHSDVPGSVEDDPASIMGRVLVQHTPITSAVFRCRGRIYPSGAYRVSLRLRAAPPRDAGEDTPVWTLRAFVAETDESLAERSFGMQDLPGPNRYGWVSFDVELPKAARVGFEMTSRSPAHFALDAWHMVFANELDRRTYEAEDCFHAGRVVGAADAQGRGVVQVDDRDPTEGVVRGPYRILAPGDYKATVRLAGTGPATIYVRGRTSPVRPVLQEFAEYEWTPSTETTGVETIAIPFSVPEAGTIVECSIDRLPGSALRIDSIHIASAR